ncbi:uncharacterized protein N7506_005342 [Penicillium brevicompactum]|uniref:uncharacterized protein n=1 Tax=Penicillium brevicompactum TaxID=5074 RepID=UPI002541DE83|nr:uncharacterized protein N7506_005342 [Penicillium brevicompactum]KAJ5337320.1 hypothetical protein N7506_005342 [Penicillium brevicompactum]
MSLSREWYVGKGNYDSRQAANNPDDLAKQLALVASMNRRFDKFGQLMGRAKSTLEHHVTGGNMVHFILIEQDLRTDNIIDAVAPRCLCNDISLEVNYTWVDLLSTKMTFKYLTMLFTKQPITRH